MTERKGARFDDQATPPPAADSPESFANASGPSPLRPHSDKPEPAEQNQRGNRPPAVGSGAVSGAPAPETGDDAPYQWPDQPGTRHVGPSEETTEVVDRSRVPVPDRTRGRAEAPRPVPPHAGPDWRAPSEPFGQPPAPGHLDAAQRGGSRYDAVGSPGQQPPAPGSASPPRSGAHAERRGPLWQEPPESSQEPAGEWSDDRQGFSQAQGSAANWNYVDSIRSSELVPTRRIPPGRGWRKAVYLASFKLINLGQSPDERYQAELETKIRSLLRGTYKIGVLGKGGVGKSTIAASVGSVFAEFRLDDRVVAIDADTAFGKLASRIDPSTAGSYWELATDRHLFSFGDVRSRVGSNKTGLFVLAGEAATARRRVLDAAIYREAALQLDKHFTLSIVDCGSTLDSPVTQEVLTDVDALIVVSSPWYDGASAAGQTLEWLANNGLTGLLHRTVVVVNDSDGHAARRDRALLVERFGGRGQKVIEMPYDEHLRPGGVIDVKEELNRLTRRRLMELAAAVAEHFAATADRPRGAVDDRDRR
jgi:MinD-like ATPase involved in chromosome partitioning or flagellar assembly